MTRLVSGLVAGILLLGSGAFAQIATNTSLVGTVTDPSGNVIPGATVTALDNGTQDTYNATTNDQGYYAIEFVRVGNYNVTVAQPGFQRVTKTGIQVDINQTVRTDITLPVGDVVAVRHRGGHRCRHQDR